MPADSEYRQKPRKAWTMQNGTASDTEKSPAEDNINAQSRAKIIISELDPGTGLYKDRPQSDTDQNSPAAQNKKTAFILRKILNADKEEMTGQIEIVDHDLWQLLKGLLKEWPYHGYRGDPIFIRSPYEELILYWDKLQEAAKETAKDESDKQSRLDLQLLLDTIAGPKGSGDSKLDEYLKSRDSDRERQCVSFDSLWTLFLPGALVYGKPFLGHDQVFFVLMVGTLWPEPPEHGEKKHWDFEAMIYDWNGVAFKRSTLVLTIPHFEGSKPITGLPFYPLSFHRDSETLRTQLIERGKEYRRLCSAKSGSSCYNYTGEVWNGNDGFSVDGRVMIDFKSYLQHGPRNAKVADLPHYSGEKECPCDECERSPVVQQSFKTRFDREEAETGWEDEQYLLCPPRVLGYVLRERRWAQLQVSKLSPIPEEDKNNSWSKVQMADGDKTKELILNLVKGHGTGESRDHDGDLQVDDIVRKKGKGPPGVGKTSTAETVAEAARRPLFPVSVANVGTEPGLVESNLGRIFTLAASWQAILLIHFDVAVHSRIHVAIKYNSLSPDQTMNIFKGFLDPLEEKNAITKYEAIIDWIKEDVCKLGLDGRQIRNILTSALTLVRANGRPKLEKQDLKTILNNVRDYKSDVRLQFEKYKTQEARSQEGPWY
ncbi:MAG: hypothetical protein Q9184_005849 [Pyrenodesmia sp. 2 TL-2023]